MRLLLAVGLSLGMIFTLTSTKTTSTIEFKKLSFKEAKALAIKTKKTIFIDCYTDWCGPCKRMAKVSFTNDDVAKVYNDKFINLKVEMEKDADGKEIARMYRINAYPTVLFINGKGELVKKAVGLQSPANLIALANSVE